MKNTKYASLKDSVEAVSKSLWKYNEFLILDEPRDKMQALKISLQCQFMLLNNLLEELPYNKKTKIISKIIEKTNKCIKNNSPIDEEAILDLEYAVSEKEF